MCVLELERAQVPESKATTRLGVLCWLAMRAARTSWTVGSVRELEKERKGVSIVRQDESDIEQATD